MNEELSRRVVEMDERLRQIELREQRIVAVLDNLTQKLGDGFGVMEKSQNKLEQMILGDGGAAPGMAVRLDRLEQAQARSTWLFRAVAGAVVTLLVGAVWSLLR